ncbi:MAG: hypothetical protein NT076_03400 [Candidatus Pacearchaeota archaeon]|nr:hypothetical protein [Candidatus Pacearchaeota archaeon]
MKKQKGFRDLKTDLKEELEILRDLGVSATEMDFLIRERQQQEFRGRF